MPVLRNRSHQQQCEDCDQQEHNQRSKSLGGIGLIQVVDQRIEYNEQNPQKWIQGKSFEHGKAL